jgi:16S rRNA (guanine527-N7)-methyltransferase|tara:strand:+ start:2045 stop:2668 length:624 start_codon:yes stop_codon:yes gene_type:complete
MHKELEEKIENSLPKQSKEEVGKIKEFVVDAIEFNKSHNIFVRELAEEVFEKDILDCMPLIEKIKDNEKILDMGSGGGFPGLLIAILRPNCEIHLLEKSQKKCYFLNKTIHKLGLLNAKTLNINIKPNNKIGAYNLITSRAFSSTENTLNLSKTNLEIGGRYILLKGREEKITEELESLDTNKYKYEIIKIQNTKHERHLVEIKINE